VSLTDADQAEGIVASGKADLIALARGILYDPRWSQHAAANAQVSPMKPEFAINAGRRPKSVPGNG
jgi:2,4-dienoyl-CoA reductase-like NADH-dependent reductase (Old Yellow Enzyme family)